MRRRVPLAPLLWAALCGPARADNIDELGRALRTDPSYKVKVQAAMVLGRLRDPRGVEPLLAALKDQNETVRGTAAMALGRVGDPRAIDPLKALAQDGSDYVREAVSRSVASLQLAKAAPAPPAPPPPASAPSIQGTPPAGSRFFVAVSFRGATGEGPRRLEDSTRKQVAKLPRVTTVFDGEPTAPALAQRKLSGWSVEGQLGFVFKNGMLDCNVNAAIATFPEHSIKATTSLGASVDQVSGPDDAGAQKACVDGVASAVAESVEKFLARQK